MAWHVAWYLALAFAFTGLVYSLQDDNGWRSFFNCMFWGALWPATLCLLCGAVVGGVVRAFAEDKE